MDPTRIERRVLLALAAGVLGGACRSGRRATDASALGDRLAALEREGRLGVAVVDTGTGAVHGRRLDERFAMCSTFKLVLAAQVFQRAAEGGPALDAPLDFEAGDLVSHAPLTRALVEAAHARGARRASASRRALAHAAQTTSDNAATNVLLRDLGGPSAFTAYCRRHGDQATRLDRYEPEMSDVGPGDERDTTTPRAMAHLVARLLGPSGLPPAERALLRAWLLETQTGAARVRAGLPPTWIAGDKTGTGGGTCTVKVNDVVWIEPPGRAPLVVAAYYDTATLAEWPSAAQEAVLADVGRAVAASHL